MTSLPLQNIRVIDFSRLLPGPFCSMILADMGAEVIKIEDLTGDYIRWFPPLYHGEGTHFLALNRNKKSLAINLKAPAGVAVAKKLVESAQVVLESFRPGVMDRLGLGYLELKKANPALIYCAISGYGQSGPLKEKSGHDLTYLARSGALSINGTPDNPTFPGFQTADITGGSLYAVIGILGAIINNLKTGQGDFLDISMTDGTASLLTTWLSQYLLTSLPPKRGQEILNGGYACYQIYKTQDQRHLALAALEPKFWQGFCAAVERPEWIALQYAEEKVQADLIRQIQEMFLSRPLSEWAALFNPLDVCVEPVVEFSEIPADPLFSARRLIFQIEAEDAPPLSQIKTPVSRRTDHTLPPKLGEHTEEILKACGYQPSEIEELRNIGVI